MLQLCDADKKISEALTGIHKESYKLCRWRSRLNVVRKRPATDTGSRITNQKRQL